MLCDQGEEEFLQLCSTCNFHSWICKNHKTENKSKLDKFQKEYREKYKLRLVFLVSPIAPTTEVIPREPEIVSSSASASVEEPATCDQAVTDNAPNSL